MAAVRASLIAACFGLRLAGTTAADDDVAIERPRTVGEGHPVAVERPRNAAAVEHAPPPGLESGRLDVEPGDSPMRIVARTALVVPRALFEIGFAPVRGGVYLVDRYRLVERYRRWFYNDAGTFGVMPWGRYDSDQGVIAGARIVWQTPGDDHVGAFAGAGLRTQEATLSLRSRMLARRVVLGADGEFRQRPRAAFYGIGNGDEATATVPPAMPIDPLVDPTAIETRYRKRAAQASISADVRLFSDAYVRAAGDFSDVSVAPNKTDDLQLEEVYDPAALVGFSGYQVAFGELELRWDGRDRSSIWEPRSMSSRGSLAAVFAGPVRIVSESSYWRYGIDLQHYLRLRGGPQVLAARVVGEGVTASLDEIPFPELPSLGGSTLLRGYSFERFRDRIALAGTLEYQWDLSAHMFASLFVDVGRVYPTLSDLTLDGLRCGYGIAVEGHTYAAFVARASLASSIDGGVFVNLRFDPVFEIRRREQRL